MKSAPATSSTTRNGRPTTTTRRGSTAYGVFAQAHWVQYVDEAGIDGWEDGATLDADKKSESFATPYADKK
jgi:hypothetical protein